MIGMADKVTLTVTHGPIQGQSFVFEQHDLLLFGRAQDCHICLPPDDRTASRYHFLLEVSPPLARVRDVGSLNGTYVNGVKHGGRKKGQAPEDVPDDYFAQVDLRNGDRIRVGTQYLNFKYIRPRSDVWSIAATFYMMLTGTYPREQKPGQDPIQVILKGQPILIRQREPSIPQAIADVIDRALLVNTALRVPLGEKSALPNSGTYARCAGKGAVRG